MRGITRQRCLGFLVLGTVTIGLCYASYYQLYQRGAQAEARLMLSYLQTLQRVYRSEHGQYVDFNTYYGAPIQGHDNCEQPMGAAQLGFLLHGCHEIKAPAPRYAYRSLILDKPAPAYQLEARSGSDQAGRSLICFNPDGHELWQISQNQQIMPTKSCW